MKLYFLECSFQTPTVCLFLSAPAKKIMLKYLLKRNNKSSWIEQNHINYNVNKTYNLP